MRRFIENAADYVAAISQHGHSRLIEEVKRIRAGLLEGAEEVYRNFDASYKVALATASAFKDEQGYLKNTLDPKRQEAKAQILELQKQYNRDLLLVADELRERYFDKLIEKPHHEFLDAVSLYEKFKIQPSELQAEALLKAARGNLLSLMVLNRVLETCGSELAVSFDEPETFEADVATLKKIAYSSYGQQVLPDFAESEAIHAIYGEEPDGVCPFEGAENHLNVEFMRHWETAPADSVRFTMKETGERLTDKKLEEICDRWKQLSDGKSRYMDRAVVEARLVKRSEKAQQTANT